MQCAGIKYLCWQKACNRQLKIRDNEIEVCGESWGEAGGLQEQKGEGPKWVVVCAHGPLLLVLLIPTCLGGGPAPSLGALQRMGECGDQPSPSPVCTPASGRSNCHSGDFNREPPEVRWGRDHPAEGLARDETLSVSSANNVRS